MGMSRDFAAFSTWKCHFCRDEMIDCLPNPSWTTPSLRADMSHTNHRQRLQVKNDIRCNIVLGICNRCRSIALMLQTSGCVGLMQRLQLITAYDAQTLFSHRYISDRSANDTEGPIDSPAALKQRYRHWSDATH
jgi:hypothetical protein